MMKSSFVCADRVVGRFLSVRGIALRISVKQFCWPECTSHNHFCHMDIKERDTCLTAVETHAFNVIQRTSKDYIRLYI